MYPALLGTLSSFWIMSCSVFFISLIAMLTVCDLLYRSCGRSFFSLDIFGPLRYNIGQEGRSPWCQQEGGQLNKCRA